MANRIRRGLCLVVCLTFALLIPIQTAGAASEQERMPSVDPVGNKDSFSAVLYNNTNGLPTSEVNEIVQTEEGFVWIACYSGLIRYDGTRFERTNLPSGIGGITCLCADSRGRLWIGTNDSGLAVMEKDDGEVRTFDVADGLGSRKINTLAEDADGCLCIGTTAGIARITPDYEFLPVTEPLISNCYIDQMILGSDGLLYCISEVGDLFTLRHGKLTNYMDHTDESLRRITSVLPDPVAPGKVYVGTDNEKIWYGNRFDDFSRMEPVDISPLTNVYYMQKIGNRVWICAINGIGVLDDSGFHTIPDLPLNDSINDMMMDYEGNLWFTSSRQGVMKLVPNSFVDISGRLDLPERVVNCTCMDRGKLFIGTDKELFIADGNGLVREYPLRSVKTASGKDLEADDLLELLDGTRIRSILPDSCGRLWISTWRGCGLLCCDGDEATAYTDADGMVSMQIRAVCELADDSIAVAATGGVNVIKNGSVTASYTPENGILNPEILTVCAGSDGDILAGSNGDGIYILSDGGIRRIGLENGLSSQIVMRIKYDSYNGVYWIVTSNSLAWMTEDYQITTIRNFPYSNNFDLYRNSSNEMWVLSSNGIYVAPVADLITNGEIRTAYYDMAHGLQHLATGNSYSALTPEGDLYIAGNSGVTKISIDTPPDYYTELKQAIPYLEADSSRIYPDETGVFNVPAGTYKLTVYGFVFNYSLNDPKVTYRLEGFDREDVTVTLADFDPVVYTNLPGGSYRFVMHLQEIMGGDRSISVPIVKQKKLHEHLWFYLLLILALGSVVAAAVSVYFRKEAMKMERKHQEAMEKERLLTELKMANRIQESMLPHQFPPFPNRAEFDIYASMNPARAVGGDFYDYFLIDDDHLCLVIADVSGKGIPAALFMMVSMVILQNNALMDESVSEIMSHTNEAICENNLEDMFVTAWLGILEISTGKITAVNAGHEYPAVMKNGLFSLHKDKHSFVIGGMPDICYQEYTLQMERGDKLFLYTDGVPEATDAADCLFGTERMVEALNTDPAAPPEQILRNVKAAVDDFVKNAEQFDDLTMLCFEYRGQEE